MKRRNIAEDTGQMLRLKHAPIAAVNRDRVRELADSPWMARIELTGDPVLAARYVEQYVRLRALPRRDRRLIRKRWRLSLAALAFALVVPQRNTAEAGQTITVNNASEFCTAISHSNGQQPPYNGTNTITLGAGITGPDCDPVASAIVIQGSGSATLLSMQGDTLQVSDGGDLTANNVVVDGGSGAARLFEVDEGATLKISNSTLQHATAAMAGAAVFNYQGTVTISDSYVTGNQATGKQGGGIYNFNGSVTANNTQFVNNVAAKGGAISNRGVSASLSVSSCDFADNTAADEGGALHIYHAGKTSGVSIESSTLHGNQAKYGGGIYSDNAYVTLASSNLYSNTASAGGGAIKENRGHVAITGTTISGNSAGGHGGGINNRQGNMSIQSSTISGNVTSGKGGGIYHKHGDKSCVYYACTSANYSSGYIACTCATYGEHGGGKLNIGKSTISGNSAKDWGGGISTGDANTTLITNSTLIDNTSDKYGGGFGGKRESGDYIRAKFTHVTIVGNHAHDKGGGIASDDASRVTVKYSLVSGNTTGDNVGDNIRFHGGSESKDHLNYYNVLGYNNDSGVAGHNVGSSDVIPSASQLDAIVATSLADNGGPTQTLALPGGSPAIDLIPNSDTTASDQRDYSRPHGSKRDAGAIEQGAAPGAVSVEQSRGVVRGAGSDQNGVVKMTFRFRAPRRIDLSNAVVSLDQALGEAGFDLVRFGDTADENGFALTRSRLSTRRQAFFYTDGVGTPRVRLALTRWGREIRGRLRIDLAAIDGPRFCDDSGRTTLSSRLSISDADGAYPAIILQPTAAWRCRQRGRLVLRRR